MTHWWHERVLYEIYTPSYYDSNKDGIGDISGIKQKLDYIQSLGIGAIWLTPFYSSPKVDNGYDISDYYTVDSAYGCNNDIDQLIKEAHKRDIKIVIDMVLNHTSDQHPWFIESRSSKKNPKRDWYIWKDSVKGIPPNNWESFFSGSAWEYDQKTNSYYYHAFSKAQVDLNWSNVDVRSAMYDVLIFWLEKGVDGFRLDVINFLKTDNAFIDNPYDKAKNKQIHLYDKNQKGVKSILKEIRSVCKPYGDIFLLGEIGNDELDEIMQYVDDDYLDAALNFNIGSIKKLDIQKINNEFLSMETKYAGKTKTFFFSSHDMSRHSSRFSHKDNYFEIIKLIALFLLSVNGVPILYYGEEIGMKDMFPKNDSDIRDIQARLKYQELLKNGFNEQEALSLIIPFNRDVSRSPMQWDATKFAGFSKQRPWLPISDDYEKANVLPSLRQSIANYP